MESHLHETQYHGARAALADFVLEGLCATKKITRTDEGRLEGYPQERNPRRERDEDADVRSMMEDEPSEGKPKGRKKYYN